ncbi:hypothetical protein V3C99_007990 [Haemonchus contortus]
MSNTDFVAYKNSVEYFPNSPEYLSTVPFFSISMVLSCQNGISCVENTLPGAMMPIEL